ncbi:MAG: ABC transporter permease [Nocardiopsaceae bacterium]|nr:ABC transporter permease [Nocardiopsaceae bacterium]
MADTFTVGGAKKPRWSVVREHPSAAVSALFILVLLVAGTVLPMPYDPRMPDPFATLVPPSAEHWFGTDSSGSDVFSRVIAAAQVDLGLALGGTAVSLLVGVPLGLLVSSKGAWGERSVRALDAFQAFPLLILALALVSLSGNRMSMVIVAIALINVPRYMRLMRSEILALRESRFIEAAYATGSSRLRVMWRHLLPNSLGVILVQTSLTIANAIVIIAAMSFVGVGATPPTPSWGSMIRAGAENMAFGQWWVAVFPGLFVFLCVLCFNRIADALGDITSVRRN